MERSVAGIPSKLSVAGIAQQRAVGNALTFQLAYYGYLRASLDAGDLAFPSWPRLMSLVRATVELSRLEEASAMTRRVDPNPRRVLLRKLSDEMGVIHRPVMEHCGALWRCRLLWQAPRAQDSVSQQSAISGQPSAVS